MRMLTRFMSSTQSKTSSVESSDLLLRRGHLHRAGSQLESLAAAHHDPFRQAVSAGHWRGVPDLPVLCPARGPGAAQRALLLPLRTATSGSQRTRRRRSQEAVGSEWEVHRLQRRRLRKHSDAVWTVCVLFWELGEGSHLFPICQATTLLCKMGLDGFLSWALPKKSFCHHRVERNFFFFYSVQKNLSTWHSNRWHNKTSTL